MRTCLIVGAGQLGSRHLQGLVKFDEMMEIYVIDPSIHSLKIAKEREKEIAHRHKIIYSQVWTILPDFFEIVIIATNANVREAVINNLLENHTVKYLILEKVLFQELEAYQRVSDLIIKHKVVVYVNHARRMFESYKFLKTKLKKDKQNIYTIVGGAWGIGCNGLHFLDLLVFLSGKKLKDINVDGIDEELTVSSRKGFIEFTGTLTGQLEDNSFFSITSLNGIFSSITLAIFNDEQRFLIQEGGTPQIYKLERERLFAQQYFDFKVQYQSDLTKSIALELLQMGFCDLPKFDEARHSHELFIKGMLIKYNKITGLKATILPIT